VNEIALTPLELIERIAALVTPPRTHRHHCFGVLAPNLPPPCWPSQPARGRARARAHLG
jgi:Putative transposase